MRSLSVALAAGCLCLASSAGLGQSKASEAELRKDQIARHERVAALHVKAAKCLKAGKPIADCNNEMRSACQQLDDGICPGMRMGMYGSGPGMHGMMGPGNATR